MSDEQEYEEAYAVISTGMLMLVEHHMGWDPAKVLKWMSTENPHLGNMTPKELIMSNRAHKVLRFIETRMDEDWSCE